MAELCEIQQEVNRQLKRDYGAVQSERLRSLCLLGLGEEVGEVQGLEKRRLRQAARDEGKVSRERYIEELGDVLWYLSAACTQLDIPFEEIWRSNQAKLIERYGE